MNIEIQDVYIYKQGCRAGKDDRVLIDDGTWPWNKCSRSGQCPYWQAMRNRGKLCSDQGYTGLLCSSR